MPCIPYPPTGYKCPRPDWNVKGMTPQCLAAFKQLTVHQRNPMSTILTAFFKMAVADSMHSDGIIKVGFINTGKDTD